MMGRGRREERPQAPAFSLFPSSPTRFSFYFFLIIAIFIGIPSGSFCGEERLPLFLNYMGWHRKTNDIIKSRVQREQRKRMVAVLLWFCKAPRNDEIALQQFFSLLQQRKNIFLLHLCCMQFFSSDKRLQEIFFQNHPTLPPTQEVNGRPLTWAGIGRLKISIQYGFPQTISLVSNKLQKTQSNNFKQIEYFDLFEIFALRFLEFVCLMSSPEQMKILFR